MVQIWFTYHQSIFPEDNYNMPTSIVGSYKDCRHLKIKLID